MKSYLVSIALLLFGQAVQAQVVHRGSMSEMGKSNFKATIFLDSLPSRNNLYGIGPYGKMQGEITVLNGNSYVSEVQADGTATVSQNWKAEAPFFVYANVDHWKRYPLNVEIKNISEL
jgi:acetolactate decarboxylase